MMTDMAEERMGGRMPTLCARLFRPFEHIAGAPSLALGLVAILAAGFVGGLSGTYFDGVLDTHTGFAVRPGLFLGAGFLDWLSLSVVLLVMGKLASRTAFRPVDLFGTQALARWPTLVAALAALVPSQHRLAAGFIAQVPTPAPAALDLRTVDFVFGGLAIIVMILCLIWMVWLMYDSYSICCNLRGGKAVRTFIAALLLAEIVSKIAIVRVLLG